MRQSKARQITACLPTNSFRVVDPWGEPSLSSVRYGPVLSQVSKHQQSQVYHKKIPKILESGVRYVIPWLERERLTVPSALVTSLPPSNQMSALTMKPRTTHTIIPRTKYRCSREAPTRVYFPRCFEPKYLKRPWKAGQP